MSIRYGCGDGERDSTMPASCKSVGLAGMDDGSRSQGAAPLGDPDVMGRVKPHFQAFGARDLPEFRDSRPGFGSRKNVIEWCGFLGTRTRCGAES